MSVVISDCLYCLSFAGLVKPQFLTTIPLYQSLIKEEFRGDYFYPEYERMAKIVSDVLEDELKVKVANYDVISRFGKSKVVYC